MNSDQVQGTLKQVKGTLKEQWGKLTDDDITTIGGKKDQLIGKLQERYGYTKDQAQKEADAYHSANASDIGVDGAEVNRAAARANSGKV